MSRWDARYAQPDFAYGKEPNDWLIEAAAAIPEGPVLCLAEGQGRNAVYLASLGHQVWAVDQSAVGLARARELAAERGVSDRVTTVQDQLEDLVIEREAWAGIVAIFMHLPAPLRHDVYQRAVRGLVPGGACVIEAYTPRQLALGTGGPPEVDLLLTLDDLRRDLSGLVLEVGREVEREIHEGQYHQGRSSVVQVLARKPGTP